MFIVQTYFSNEIAGRAKAYVYYVELPGNPINLRDPVRDSFRELGDEYGKDVSLFFPDVGSVSRIRDELKRELREYFEIGSKETPCLIISPVVINNISGRKNWIYFSLRDRLEISSSEISSTIRDCVEAIEADDLLRERPSIFGRLLEALEAKPGAFGFRLDLRKLFRV
jgi:hypothetical protein